jgi:hypothetical protein
MSNKTPVETQKPTVTTQAPPAVSKPQQLGQGTPLPAKILADITALRKENTELKAKLAQQKNTTK